MFKKIKIKFYKNFPKPNQQGSALLMTLLILSAILLVALGATNIAVSGLRMSQTQKDSVKAYFAAETGIEKSIWEMQKNSYTLPNYSQANVFSGNLINGSNYSVDYNLTNEYITFSSVGTYGKTTRAVEASFENAGSVAVITAISSCEELQKIGDDTTDYPLDGNYILTQDVDCAETQSWNDGKGFKPIGNSVFGDKFSGVFDGGEHTISNLYINRPFSPAEYPANYTHIGLFGYTKNAEIKNIGLINENITGYRFVGGLAGTAESTQITNCHTSGTITSTFGEAGGLVALGGGLVATEQNVLAISGCYSECAVTSAGNMVGGLVGDLNGSIINSYAVGNVNGNDYLGGLVGQLGYAVISTISNSFSTGSVGGQNRIGGLLGYLKQGTISNSYSFGYVSGVSRIGGLAGEAYNGSIINSYAGGEVIGSSYVGGLFGVNDHLVCAYSYWNKESTGQSNYSGDGVCNGVEGKTTNEMKIQSTYFDWDFYDSLGNPSGIWNMQIDSYPCHQWRIAEGGNCSR
ncbi:MAG: GLUG motif-containing protein [Patescibacteria group bacterium]|nr:GLUG motif-containing protein [Patescibacteria group bacterium]MDD4611272.1 GLUG motif-containing protein [Patescibacteria group bacterium]